MKHFVKRLNEVGKDDVPLVGGKAASLGELLKIGVNVPPGFVVTTHAYRDFADSQLPLELAAVLLLQHAQLGVERVAVRSSAVAEDSGNASWAGQLETYLNVGMEDLTKSIAKCWESINTDRAVAYADDHAVAQHDRAVAVVVQAMVDSDVSGVMFTANPVTGSTGEFVIESAYGLGELVVQGATSPDTFVVDASGAVKDHQPHAQREMLAYRDSEQRMVPLSTEQTSRATLTPEQLIELAEAGKRIAGHYGAPQDIEWAFSDGRLYIVQARPITTLA